MDKTDNYDEQQCDMSAAPTAGCDPPAEHCHGPVGMYPVLAGAIGVGAVFFGAKHIDKLRSSLVPAFKELHSFGTWVLRTVEQGRERVEDIAAEAKHGNERSDLAEKSLLERQTALIERFERLVQTKGNPNHG